MRYASDWSNSRSCTSITVAQRVGGRGGCGASCAAYLEERGGAVGNHAVTLHLTKAQAAVACAPLHGLPREDLHGASCARVDLVVNHVLQPLVVRWAQEDLGVQHAASVTVVHRFVAAQLVATALQLRTDIFHSHVRERCRVTLLAVQRAHLTHQTLHQVPDRHARRDSVRVHDDVRRDALHRERHILLRVRDTDGSLLPVARGELVANLWHADRAHAGLDELQPLLVGGEHHLVYHASLRGAQGRAHISLRKALRAAILGLGQLGGLSNNDIFTAHARARRRQPVVVQLVVRRVPHCPCGILVGTLQHLGLHGARTLLLIAVAPIEDGAEEPAVNGGLVHDNTIFLVVACVDHDAHDGVLTCR
eukprot:scaffold3740_cov322-Prasinococcus_capsulatus_cf.AAC.4